MTDELFSELKNYLNITWDDINTDLKIKGIGERGMRYLEIIAGSTLDYLIEDKPRELLFEYCRYVWSDGFNEFQTNYMAELLTLQQIEQVKAYEASNV